MISLSLRHVACAAAGLLFSFAAWASEKPNVIFIMADDIGYGDLSCQRAKHVKTPNLDRLATEGMRFTDAHSPAATCTPTRRALITGVYSWRQQAGSAIAPGDAALSIPTSAMTIASIMKQGGFRTGVVGKWHIGLGPEGGPDWNGEIMPGPMELGFDSSFIMAATGDRVPTVYVEGHRVVGLDPADPISVSYKYKVGTEPTGKENPELLKLKHTHGHDMTIVNGVGRIGWMTGGKTACWVDEDMADTFTKKALAFIEQSKDAPFFLLFTPHDVHVPRVPNARFKGTSPVGTRGDAIHELDDSVGQVLALLDRLKLAENTIVIFTSDNGGVLDDGYEDTGKMDYSPNAPLTGFKGGLFEGGHRVPFLARWPTGIKAGSESAALITHLDMPATLAALLDVKIPEGQCRDSISALPALLGEKHLRETFIAHSGGTKGPFAVRQGEWKLIEAGGGASYKAADGHKGRGKDRLFNLSQDLTEQKDLAAENPEKVATLKAILTREGARP